MTEDTQTDCKYVESERLPNRTDVKVDTKNSNVSIIRERYKIRNVTVRHERWRNIASNKAN